MKRKENIIGKKVLMNNGQYAVCIADRGYEDIDIKFEDGTVVKNKRKASFYKGQISNPSLGRNAANKRSILGISIRMNNGQMATCIAYRRSDDIDIQFEDGTVVKNKTKHSFLRGYIKNPNIDSYETLKNKSSCKGETRMMNCGMNATCIEYRGADDIDIQFEDGTVVFGKTKNSFYKGQISNPKIGAAQVKKRSSIENMTRKMNCGMNATCIAYRKSNDIDVQFEDGTIVRSTNKSSFLKGKIANPSLGRYFTIFGDTNCLNETRTMNCGMSATCIEFINVDNITVRFEDGTIIQNKSKSDFYKGTIANPNLATKSLPEAMVFYAIKKAFPDSLNSFRPKWLVNPKTNKPLEIDVWIPSLKTGIEYDGVKWHSSDTSRAKRKCKLIEKSKEIKRLITILEKGAVPHKSSKNLNIQLENSSVNDEYFDLINELQIVVKNILRMLGSDCEVDILSDTDFEHLRTTLRSFMGPVLVPQKLKTERVVLAKPKTLKDYSVAGLSLDMNNGQKATCIEDKGYKYILIQFEDGTIVQTTRALFRNRNASNPTVGKQYVQKLRTSIKGQKRLMNCGMHATVVEDRGSSDIDIQFEDGTIVCHKQRVHFRKGTIRNPNIKNHNYRKRS